MTMDKNIQFLPGIVDDKAVVIIDRTIRTRNVLKNMMSNEEKSS